MLLPFSSARDGCSLKGNYHLFWLRESQTLATAFYLLTGQIHRIVQDILDELFQTICDLMVGFIITQCCGGQTYKQVQKWISKIHGRQVNHRQLNMGIRIQLPLQEVSWSNALPPLIYL